MRLITKSRAPLSPHPQANSKGFTLIEVMTVCVVLGVIATLGLSRYNSTLEANYCRNAQMNLLAINSASKIYFSQYKSYIIPSGTDLTAMNHDLALNINDPQFQYSSWRSPTTYGVLAQRVSSPNYTCTISQDALSSSNPSCIGYSACPSVIGP